VVGRSPSWDRATMLLAELQGGRNETAFTGWASDIEDRRRKKCLTEGWATSVSADAEALALALEHPLSKSRAARQMPLAAGRDLE